MAITGFNIGSTMSLEDMALSIGYLCDKEVFKIDLQDIKEKLGLQEKEKVINEINK